MGEIGFPRREFLYDIRWWEARRIIRGADARTRQLWSAIRWQTYYIMSAQIGSDGMRKSNINQPRDLIELPWEKDTPPPISDDEIKALQAEMAAINKKK